MGLFSSRAGSAASKCLLGLALLLLGSQANAQFADIPAALAATPTLSTLATAIDAANLTSLFTDPSANLTIFAPSNDAFTATLDQLGLTLAQVAANTQLLQGILALHVLPTVVNSSQVPTDPTSVPTLAGTGALQRLTVSQPTPGTVVVDSPGATANVTTADVTAGNTVIHIIDAVLLPFYTSVAQAALKNNLTALAGALGAAGRLAAVQNSSFVGTVFAPTNEAFDTALAALGSNVSASLLGRVLDYHIVPGAALPAADLTNGSSYTTAQGSNISILLRGSTVGIVTPGGVAEVAVPDVPVAAGRAIVHVVSSVLLPFYSSIARALADYPTTTLQAAAAALNLTTTLSATNTSLTVFAPVDDAFARVLAAAGLSAPQLLGNTAVLSDILLGHVLAGPVDSASLSNGQRLNTLNNKTLTVNITGSSVFLTAQNNGTTVRVLTPDVSVGADRSLVHILDGVLIDGNTLAAITSGNPLPPSPPAQAFPPPRAAASPPPPTGSAMRTGTAPVTVALLALLASMMLSAMV